MAPRLDFTPALSSTTHVSLTHEVSTSLPLKVQVQLSRVSYEKLRDAGRQIQVWSDMHITRRGEQQWKETPFLLPETTKTSSSQHESTVNTISLLSAEDEVQSRGPEDPKDVNLVASLTVPNAQGRYSFTFRIAGPYSQIEWLGNMGSNGVVVVGRAGQRVGFESTSLQHWNAGEGKWEGASRGSEIVEIGRIANLEVRGWAFDANGARKEITAAEDVTANLIILSPASGHVTTTYPLIVASPSPVTLTTSGQILVAPPAASSTQLIVKELNSQSSFEDVRALVHLATPGTMDLVSMSPQTSGFLVFRSNAHDDVYGHSNLYVIPRTLGRTSGRSRLSLNLETILMNAFPTMFPTYAIYEKSSNAALFINQHDIHSLQPEIGVVTGPTGGELIIVPAIEVTEQFDDAQWKFAAISSTVTDIQRETIMSTVEPVASTIKGTTTTVEDHPPSNLPSPPPSLPAQSEGSRSPTHDHVDLAVSDTEEETPEAKNGAAETEREDHAITTYAPVKVNPVLVQGRSPTGIFSSLHQTFNNFLLTWWLRAFGLLRLLLFITAGHRYRSLGSIGSYGKGENAHEPESSQDIDSETKLEVVSEPVSCQDEGIVSTQPPELATVTSPEAETRDEKVVKDERPTGTTILTPPLTPPTHVWNLDAAIFQTPAPLKHELRLTLRPQEDGKEVELIAFHQGKTTLPKNFEVLVDGAPVNVDQIRKQNGWWLIQSHFVVTGEHRVIISLSAE